MACLAGPAGAVTERGGPGDDRERLLRLVRATVRRGPFTLASGRTSDLYIDGRLVTLDAEGATLTARLFLPRIAEHRITAVGGLSVGADPLVSTTGALALALGRCLRLVYVRKEPKGHGTKRRVEGPPLAAGDRVAVLEDVVTSGASALRAVDAIRAEYGCTVPLVLALVDREEGGAEALAGAGLAFEALFRRTDLV